MQQFKERIHNLWKELYGTGNSPLFDDFISEIDNFKATNPITPHEEEWYKDVTIYSLYVDLFNTDFNGLIAKLDYLSHLGVSCLWLLPILDSPMRDAGFDIKNYQKIRENLLGDRNGSEKNTFDRFVEAAKGKNIKVIFDIAINHTSNEHPWFQEAITSKDNIFRDYYIWSKDTEKYKDARIIFYGIETSNWQPLGDEFYFHRFFDFQPDLNYRNPLVLIEMTRNFLFWLKKGVDGFRADAIPYLWKEEGTTCENLPKTHTIVKFFRMVLDYIKPNTLLLAEACQKPKEVVKYFGNGDECHAGYHFPLMPQIYKAIGSENSLPIINTLHTNITPDIPQRCQWFTFLRCHDELSLELTYVSEEDRKYIHDHFCKKPQWDFRLGQGISARLSELMDRDSQKISLAFSIMLTLPGTPIIYYGDEFGKLNDEEYYKDSIKLVGKDDTRFLVRGRVDWDYLERELENPLSYSSIVYNDLKRQIITRSKHKAFGRGNLVWHKPLNSHGKELSSIMMFERTYLNERLIIIHNLSNETTNIKSPVENFDILKEDILGKKVSFDSSLLTISIKGYASYWLKINL